MSKELTTSLFDATQRVMAKERMDIVNKLVMLEYESEQNRFSMELRIQITELQYKLARLIPTFWTLLVSVPVSSIAIEVYHGSSLSNPCH